MDNVTQFTIRYNRGNGVMTLNLERFFERNEKSRRFLHITKPDIYKVLKLVHEWCEDEDKRFLLKWFSEHDCQDLVDYYTTKYRYDGNE